MTQVIHHTEWHRELVDIAKFDYASGIKTLGAWLADETDSRAIYGWRELTRRRSNKVLLLPDRLSTDNAAVIYPECACAFFNVEPHEVHKSRLKAFDGWSVTIWPDVDDFGFEAAVVIACALAEAGAEVEIADLDGLHDVIVDHRTFTVLGRDFVSLLKGHRRRTH